ncbi:glycine betaine/L-proline ABC transporter substrate-binding protein ProX [Salipiger marinus]|uniref:glycine betaine/L-proline ABC transporter substrate-binding protein ProX n=1 Tax=Salipiger marinus TaxID=555512 RepID=UPI001E59FC14|nr:glycine betaine/L-proline ABC transporter substrate-binding protein ProX [Salipiger manganoxidans]MCD1618009.1 glycine betaine/L-proline ABC transporter substrate-binding protein ProX [Salipiger manganoxidans]MEB3418690.1 glycine betaine/L-proline ABC transporter substrate-binding protein ProX [Salipiger manganoxidans]
MFRRTLFGALAASTTLVGAALAQDRPGEGVTVRPVIGLITEEYFQSRILFRALEDLGYTVATPLETEIQTAHLSVGTGDGEFYPIHWQNLHQAFFDESGGDEVLERVGPFVGGMLQGYLVDKASYDAGVTDIGQLSDAAVAARFDADGNGTADLAGCVPGWGCERVIEHHLTEYGLRDTVTHNQGSYNALMADSIARLTSGNSILYFTWTPYWVSGELVPGAHVEWLSVPYTSLPDGVEADTEIDGLNLGFAVDSMYILARDEFLAENPAAARLFEMARLDVNDISAQNLLMSKGEDSSADIDRHVDAWIEEHRSDYDRWLDAARAAVAN